jgi:hypothetical protein
LKTWPASKIREIVNLLDIYVLPNANPDGRERVLNSAPGSNSRLWRKNLRLLPYRPYPDCWGEGVDLNRNFAHLWGIRTLDDSGSVATSTAECSDQYVGPSVASEAETKNVQKLLDDYPIDCFIDLHSYGELIFHPWAHAVPQTTHPTQRFFEIDTSDWHELPTDAPDYREYLPADELERFQTAGLVAAEAIRDVRPPPVSFYDHRPNYRVRAAADEYPSTGSGMDYAYARHLLDPTKRKVDAFAFETGAGDLFGNAEASFQPAPGLDDRLKQEVMSGLLSMLESCALGVLAGAPHSVNQAAWVPGSNIYRYGHNSIPNIPITGAPPDTDWSRWDMLHDGSVYRMYFFKRTSNNTLYQFAWNGSSYAFGHLSIPVLTLVGAPAGADTSSFSMLHDGSEYQLYLRAGGVGRNLLKFAWAPGTTTYTYRAAESPIAVLGFPANADFSRWSMLHDGTDARLYASASGSQTHLLQGALNSAANAFQFGYRSIAELTIEGMPRNGSYGPMSMLHDGGAYRFYFRTL